MKLRYSSASPFVRKVLIVAHEVGLADRIVCEPTNAWAPDTDLPDDNPLGKIPTLVFDDRTTLYDSLVICEYLDAHAPANPGRTSLFPTDEAVRWDVLRRQALADGLMDAAVALRVEFAIRPAELRWSGWVERQWTVIRRALNSLEAEVETFGQGFATISEIAAFCGLEFLDFRFAEEDWRANHPKLAAWQAVLSQRPSARATAPVG
ncbi:glutathione S-transferase [Nitrospirillum iridis]|uniref:Glutathione S-transferase n=1 Tax=Nitrospirillum iridis TaxID=765888 RepID=A0A7X0B649_9PROT|nr:glutathione S-transferase [Nitrospirillum iridis]MBB6255325.1 glutathione S-transferase [Nitrospirillum iridis]